MRRKYTKNRTDVPQMNASFVQQSERLVVAQICSRFDTVSIAAADAIAEVLSRFLLELGRTSQGYAELARTIWSGPYHLGRTDVNASDVFCALNNLGTTFSQVMQDAENFEIPFAHTLPPRLHIRRLPKRAPAFRELGDPALPHFPKFLPALPDRHTFQRTVGELANVPKDYEVGSVVGHKHIEAVLGGFKQSFALCKRRRFGDYESNSTLGEVVSRQYDLWQASTSSQGVDKTDACFSSFAAENMTGRVSHGVLHGDDDMGAAPQGRVVGFDHDLATMAKSSSASRNNVPGKANLASFREHSSFSNADHDTVEKLVHGHISVFESNN